jgi:hypothetical protein
MDERFLRGCNAHERQVYKKAYDDALRAVASSCPHACYGTCPTSTKAGNLAGALAAVLFQLDNTTAKSG